jgi:hypothetical protein
MLVLLLVTAFAVAPLGTGQVLANLEETPEDIASDELVEELVEDLVEEPVEEELVEEPLGEEVVEEVVEETAEEVLEEEPVLLMLAPEPQNQGQAGTTLSARITAKGFWYRDYDWTIEKTGSETELTLYVGETATVDYTVVVTASMEEFAGVKGQICVLNGGDRPTEGLELNPWVLFKNGPGPFEPLPGATTKITPAEQLGPGEEDCYEFEIEFEPVPGANYKVDARVTITNHSGWLGVPFGPSPDADFSLSNQMVVTNECIDLSDSLYGDLGTVCVEDLDENMQKTFEYSYEIGPFGVCGTRDVDNTASFVASDDPTQTGSDSWTVTVTVPCVDGCSLTPGYWKTHSMYGPARYDPAWALLGEDELFFHSGLSNYQVLWTSPSGGNAYFILAHAYLAATLNVLNGAGTTPEVDAALTAAETFFDDYNPTSKLSRTVRSHAISLAGLLDSYNNGLIGPGHCDAFTALPQN